MNGEDSDSSLSSLKNNCLSKSINRRKQLKPNRISSMQLALKQELKVNEESEEVENDEADSNNIKKTTGFDSTEAAFCSLCKKGFCNKYFLKSHMANKHGGLFEPTSTVYLGSTGSMITHFKYTTPKKQQELSQTPKTEIPSKLVEGEITVENSASVNASAATEDYCDSCQKHFCNKYYLRVS